MKGKFCVHIAGPDDLIPVHNIDEAVRAAAYLNAEYLAVLKDPKVPHSDNLTPYCFAAPMVWPHSDESHQQELDRMKARAKEKGMLPHWMAD